MEALEGELAQQLAHEADARRQRRSAAGAQDASGSSGKSSKKKTAPGTQEDEEEDEEEEEEDEKDDDEEGEPGAGRDQAIVARQAGLGGDAEGTRSSAGRHESFVPLLITPVQCSCVPWTPGLKHGIHEPRLHTFLGWDGRHHSPPHPLFLAFGGSKICRSLRTVITKCASYAGRAS